MTSADSLASYDYVNAVCDSFEDRWCSNESPQIETALEQADIQERNTLLYELLLVELYYRHEASESPNVDDYRSRFPEDVDTVTWAFHQFFLSSATQSAPEQLHVEVARLEAGDIVGRRYSVVRLLGSGAFANVYLVRDTSNGQLRALKLQHEVSSEEAPGSLLGETRTLQRVLSRAIVPVVDTGEHSDGRNYIVMEYVEGKTLKELLQDGSLTRERALHLIADLATTISSIHQQGVFHRDLKPANVIVDRYERPRVVDFGLALDESVQRQRAGEFAGSVAYMSPEQIRGESHRLDGRTDIWALGVILYEVLVGRRPFSGESREQIEDEILHRDPRPPRQIVGNVFAAEFERICLQSLSRKMTGRFATAQDMADALKIALQSTSETRAADEALASESTQRARRRVGVLLSLPVLLMIIIGGAAFFRVEMNRSKSEAADALVRSLGDTELHKVPQQIDRIKHTGSWAAPHLKRELAASRGNEEQLRYRLALLQTEPDRSQVAPALDLLLNEDAGRINVWQGLLLPNVMGEFRDEAVDFLQTELRRPRRPAPEQGWTWEEPSTALVESFARDGGRLADSFAMTPDMPLADFIPTVEALRASNYRPLKIRPFLKDGTVCVAAVWTRDGVAWRWAHSLSEEELRKFGKQSRADGFHISDLAPYIDVAENGRVVHCGVWSRLDELHATSWLIAVDANTHTTEAARQLQAGSQQQSISVAAIPSGERLTSSLWQPSNEPSYLIADESHPDYFGDVSSLLDVTVSATSHRVGTRQRFGQQLAFARQLLARTANDPASRFLAARANHYLGNSESALADLAWVAENAPELRFYALPLCALCAARSDRPAEANAYLSDYRRLLSERGATLRWSRAYLTCLQAKIEAYGGDIEKALRQLESLTREHKDREACFYAACAYSAIVSLMRDDAPDGAAQHAARAVELLQEAELVDDFRLHVTADLDGVREHLGFGELLASPAPPRYAVVWQERDDFTARFCYRLAPAEHQRKCKTFARLGYHPVAISALQPAPGEPLLVASVWHRRAHTERTEHFVNRQANAAAALLRLDADAPAWRLLRQSERPQLRSRLIARLNTFNVNRASIEQRLFVDDVDVSTRRALLLSLGDDAAGSAPPANDSLIARVSRLYEEDADAGVHSAAGWLLRSWDRQTPNHANGVAAKNAAATNEPPGPGGSATWSVNSAGQTMVLLPGPGQFAMGSPATDPDREDGEQLRLERIGHQFSISATEVTVEQWAALRSEERTLAASERDLPAQVTWYEAAEFCNRLSAREGIPHEHWCYLPNEDGRFAAGMRVAENYLARSGYRLPTEPEWEYACRAGTQTAWPHGDSPELLGRYAWFQENSMGRLHPVGELRPNDFGLFDMCGNAKEWCQDAFLPESTRAERIEGPLTVTNTTQFITRGGSYNLAHGHTRSAARIAFEAVKQKTLGFRVARTVERAK